MPENIISKEGDVLQRIAEQHHFKTMRQIVEANDTLSEKIIKNKGILPPGTPIAIPDRSPRTDTVPSGKAYTYSLEPDYMNLILRPEFTDGKLFTGWEAGFSIKYEGAWPGYQPCGPIGADGLFKIKALRSDGIWEAKLKLTKNKNEDGQRIELEFLLMVYPPYFIDNNTIKKEKDRNDPLNIGMEVPSSKINKSFSGDSEYTDPAEGLSSQKKPLGNIKLPAKRAAVFLQERSQPNLYSRNVIKADHLRFVFLDTGRWLKDGRDFGLIWGRHTYLCTYQAGGNGSSGDADLRPGLDTDFIRLFGNKLHVGARANAAWADEEDFDWDHLYIMIPDMHLMTVETSMIWRDTYYNTGVIGDDVQEGKKNELQTMSSERKFAEFADQLLNAPALKGKIKLVQMGDLYDLWVGYGQEDRNKLADHSLYDYAFKDARETRLFPLFKDTYPNMTVVLEDPAQSTGKIVGWIHEIDGQGATANPALQAFHRASQVLGNDLRFIWGNHDSYLRLDALCSQAGIPKREAIIDDFKGVLMEHGQRMEVFFSGSGYKIGNFIRSLGDRFPGNTDGDASGFIVTNIAYMAKKYEGGIKGGALLSALKLDFNDASTKFFSEGSGITDQTADAQGQYTEEHAAIWLHRNTKQSGNCPHIFVIGHTHMPALFVRELRLD